MYINIDIPMKCSKCGAINQFERIYSPMVFGEQTVKLKCICCGHEKVESIIHNSTGDATPQVYEYHQPKEIIF